MACQPAETTGAASSTLLQMLTQASQIWTLGPAMSRATSLSDLPQKEHLSFRLRLIAIMAASCQGYLDNSDARSACQGVLDNAMACSPDRSPHQPVIARRMSSMDENR